MTWTLTPQQLTLVTLLRHDVAPEYATAALADSDLLALALEHEVATTIAGQVARQFGWDAVPQAWQQEHAAVAARIGAYLAELDRLAARLAAEGIALVALKNGGIVRGIYRDAGSCPMGDLDVLVDKRHFRQAHAILLAEGFHFEFRSPLEEAELAAAEQGGGAEYWKLLANGAKLWLELQWRPVAGRWIRPDQEPSTSELLARSVALAGSDVRLLAPEDNLLQVALHTAKHTYVRAPGFRLHLDVERIVRAYPDLDWQLFFQRTTALQVKTAVYFALLLPHDLFGTPVPAQVLAALRPPAWKERTLRAWLKRVGLFEPHAAKFSKLGYIGFTALLYDDWRGLWRGIFPERAWMRRRYAIRSDWQLPLFYVKRLADLALRRVRT